MEGTQKPLIKFGWLRAVIYMVIIALVVLIFQILSPYISNLFEPGTESGDENIVSFGVLYFCMGLCIFAATWLCRKFIDRRSFESLGFTWKGYSNEAGLGFFASIALLGIGTLILVAIKYLTFTSASFDFGSLFLEVVLLLIVAFIEELLFRGYLLNNLMQSLNKWIALSVVSVLFALFHQTNPDVSLLAIVNIVVAGFLLGLNYIFTKNLWFGIFFHFAWNYFQGPVLGYDVSGLQFGSILQQTITGPELWTGGAFGFESSLLCPLLFIVAILVFTYAFLKRYQPKVP